MKSRLSSESVTEWLRYIKNAGESLNWLSPYEEDLLSILRQGLNDERRFRKSFDLLTLVFPYFALSLSHTEQWSSLLRDALLMAQDIKDNDLQVKVFRWMGEAFIKLGKHETAREAFSTALQRAEEDQIDDMKVAVYTGLFKLQWFDLKQKFTHSLVEQALETSEKIEDQALQADLFDALGAAYARLAETDIALGYGQTAFLYWASLKNHSGLGRAAYTVASIYMQIGQYRNDKRFLNQAMNFLEIARDELSHTDDKWQYPLLAYEQANIYYQLEDYEEAEIWYQHSLSEAESMNSPQYVAIAQHGLGLTHSLLGNYPLARSYMHQARKHWDQLNNSYERVSILVGLADLELRDKHIDLALTYVEEGLQSLDDVQDENIRRFMKDQFQDIIRRSKQK